MKEFVVKDSMHHTQFQWPETLLTWDAEFNEGLKPEAVIMTDNTGKEIPFQLWDVETKAGFLRRAKVSVLSSLAPGEEKRFCLQAGMPALEEALDFDISFAGNRDLFVLQYRGITFRAVCSCREKSWTCTERGSLFSDYSIRAVLDGGAEYSVRLRLMRNIPFFELEEDILVGQQESMELVLEGYDPDRRYSWCRPEEKIDQYLTEDNFVPVTVMPYENWNPWFQSKYIEVSDGELACGLFIRDNEKWDDGKYAIWGSDPALGIRTRYDGKVTWEFPLEPGRRFTGIAVYPHQTGYIEYLWTWYTLFNLNKVKQWVLEWPTPQMEYPLFWKGPEARTLVSNVFNREVGGMSMKEVIDELSKTMAAPGKINPVDCREFADWAVVFDITAAEMDQTDFGRAKAVMAFMAYVAMDENYMPTRHMLAGHPNFLADVAAVAGYAAALFPSHPDRVVWAGFFQNAVRKNLLYHIRPDVAAWKSKGGRPTENTACYNFASLVPQVRVCMLFERCGLENPLSGGWAEKWLYWLVNSLSAPVSGRRLFLPQGAHAGKFHHGYVEIPYSLMELARMNAQNAPELAQTVYSACAGSPLVSHEIEDYEKDPWRYLSVPQKRLGIPELHSEKFTGYGYILRANVGTEKEISVHLQQLDHGPNYRWGTFQNTGNGSIHYFAAGKRYSFHASEETGDRNLDACAGSCTFAVLNGHTYYNIGFADLENPLLDLGFVQGAAIRSEDEIAHLYRERSIMLCGGEYIVVYDQVADMTTRGRFSWFVNRKEGFPYIFQIKPGVPARPYPESHAVDVLEEADSEDREEFLQKGIGYDGKGDFLTIVSHLAELSAIYTAYGAEVILPGRRDMVFADSGKIRYRDEINKFDGWRGIISREDTGTARAVMLKGQSIAIDGVELAVGKETTAVSVEIRDGKITGRLVLSEEDTIFWTTDNIKESHTISAGQYYWECERKITLTELLENYQYQENKSFERNIGKHEFGFSGFDFRRKKTNWKYPFADKGE